MKFVTPSSTAGLFCALLICLSGCGTAGLNLGFMAENHEKETASNPVEQIIPVWQEAEGPGLDRQTAARGFGGQIYFITHNRGLPSEVNGKIRIYLFDDQGTTEEQAKPIHQFDFDAASWKTHLTMSKLGPAYSVFIPYTRPGRNLAVCALRIRFTPVNGTPVFSQMAAINLPGAKSTPEEPELTKKIPVPELTKRGPHALRRVTQVSTTGDLVDQKNVRHAGYETASRTQDASGRVRLSNHETDAAAAELDVHQAFLGNDIVDLPADEESFDDLMSDESGVDPTSDYDSTEVTEPSEAEDGDQTVRTYTIPLDN